MPALPLLFLRCTALVWLLASVTIIYYSLPALSDRTGSFAIAMWLGIAAVGALRRLRWGQAMLTFNHLALSLYGFLALVPDYDAKYEDITFLQEFLATKPLGIAVLAVVVMATVVLVPPVIIGWQRTWFHSKLW